MRKNRYFLKWDLLVNADSLCGGNSKPTYSVEFAIFFNGFYLNIVVKSYTSSGKKLE